MKFKTPFNHDTNKESERTAIAFEGPTMTQQHMKNECDINEIVRRLTAKGTDPYSIPIPPSIDEFTETFDFQTAMETGRKARESFMQLPAHARSAFQNNPHFFVSQVDEWLNEPDSGKREKNLEIMRALNLAVDRGPPADKTTLGDVLAAIKERTAPGASSPPEPPQTA